MISLVFFGSFQNFSTTTLSKLIDSKLFFINAVITTPPKPGNHGEITKTHTQLFCEQNNIPVYPLESLETIPITIDQPDFILVAGYGKYIPKIWLDFPKILPINIHPSLLPNYAGRFPVQWTILKGESETGITMIKMTESFTDKGNIVYQSKIDILPTDTSESLYTKLYYLSAKSFIDVAPKLMNNKIVLTPQIGTGFYARQLTKEDGYITSFDNLNTLTRALNPWPGVWTHVYDQNHKKLILKIITIDENNQPENVLIEGKKPTKWSEIFKYYSLTS